MEVSVQAERANSPFIVPFSLSVNRMMPTHTEEGQLLNQFTVQMVISHRNTLTPRKDVLPAPGIP